MGVGRADRCGGGLPGVRPGRPGRVGRRDRRNDPKGCSPVPQRKVRQRGGDLRRRELHERQRRGPPPRLPGSPRRGRGFRRPGSRPGSDAPAVPGRRAPGRRVSRFDTRAGPAGPVSDGRADAPGARPDPFGRNPGRRARAHPRPPHPPAHPFAHGLRPDRAADPSSADRRNADARKPVTDCSTDTRCIFHTHRSADADRYRHPHCVPDASLAHRHPDTHSFVDADRHAHPHRVPNASLAHRHPDTDSFVDADRHAHPHARPERLSRPPPPSHALLR